MCTIRANLAEPREMQDQSAVHNYWGNSTGGGEYKRLRSTLVPVLWLVHKLLHDPKYIMVP